MTNFVEMSKKHLGAFGDCYGASTSIIKLCIFLLYHGPWALVVVVTSSSLALNFVH